MRLFEETGSGWVARALNEPLLLCADGPAQLLAEAPIPLREVLGGDAVASVVVPLTDPNGLTGAMLLVNHRSVRLNGRRPLPASMLSTGDEIRVGAHLAIFIRPRRSSKSSAMIPKPSAGGRRNVLAATGRSRTVSR